MKYLLLISPYFPPDNSVGAKRALNLARHLPARDWQPVVLAAPASKIKHDPELQQLVPENLVTSYTFTPRKRDALFFPENKKPLSVYRRLAGKIAAAGPYYIPFDQYMWHIPFALKSARELVHKYKPELILVNADPWSALMVGHKLSKWSNIPWIADLRDPWSLHDYKMQQRPGIIQSIIRYYEKEYFQSAGKIVLNTESCRNAYRNYYSNVVDKKKFEFIRNAFDPALYSDGECPVSGKFSLHYFGSFRDYVKPDCLFELIKTFITRRGLPPEKMELILYGEQGDSIIDTARQLDILPYIRIQPRITLQETVSCLRTASVLVLLDGTNRLLQLPAKLYDYLAARRPILALSANRELDNIINQTRSGLAADYTDPEHCYQQLKLLFDNRDSARSFNEAAISEFSVENQVNRFCILFDELMSKQS